MKVPSREARGRDWEERCVIQSFEQMKECVVTAVAFATFATSILAHAASELPFDCSFTMRLGRRLDKAPCATVTPASMASRSEHVEGGATVIEWRGSEACGSRFSARAVFTPDGAGGWTYAFSYDGNESGLCVEEIRFPEITVPRTDKTAALYPKQSGMLRRPDWSKIPPGDVAAIAGPNTIGF